ncbi:Mif2p [Saccharomyces eubayanus]|uniref:Mif2p n=1 Tax=Saccharomyces eubayanus TaxID=1080349 RepID=UPI0006C46D31|nr:MIF2-like protein [Saccharomyces eubayanus]KOG98236.1 MIF2-like protein [Saccharomyces eubayanus]
MDYMNLGLRSRKTGIDVKQNIPKDEYSMENIDDFFKDDETSLISMRRKSRRKSSLFLPSSLNNNTDNVLPPFLQSYRPQEKEAAQNPSSNDGSRRSSLLSHQSSFQSPANEFEPIQEDPEEEEKGSRSNGIGTPKTNNLSKPSFKRKYSTHYDLDISEDPSVRLTPDRITNKNMYSDVPDLVADEDDDDRGNTSLNTSDNALLEDELEDDGFVPESEEDRDYIGSDSSLDSSSDSPSDVNGDDTYQEVEEEAQVSENDNEDDYIKRQATDVVRTDSIIDRNGLRKSTRVKVAPLQYWRNEKIVYKRKSSKPVLDIDKIVTYDESEDEEEILAAQRKKRQKKKPTQTRPYNYVPTGRPRGRPKKNPNTTENPVPEDPNEEIIERIESGGIENGEWLRHGILEANVKISDNIEEMKDEIIAFAPNLSQAEQVKDTKDENFSLEIMFDKHKEHFASGILKLPAISGQKKLSNSFRTYITFHVIQGIVEVTVCKNKFLSVKGSTFQIPAFNEYAIVNKGNDEARMFFVQVTISQDTNDDNDKDLETTFDTFG